VTGLIWLDIVLWTVGLTVVFEAITVVFRFGFKLEATRDTAKYVARWTRGVRIHHGYWGVPLALAGAVMLLATPVGVAFWLLVLGLALIKSDLIHHFLVLWPITGSHDFHLRYPGHHKPVFVPEPIPVPASGSR
jgi:hypothetical protein